MKTKYGTRGRRPRLEVFGGLTGDRDPRRSRRIAYRRYPANWAPLLPVIPCFIYPIRRFSVPVDAARPRRPSRYWSSSLQFPALLRFFDEDRDILRQRVNPDDARELVHLHDLFSGCAVIQGILYVDAQSRRIEVRGGEVDGDVDELLRLGIENAFIPGMGRKPQVCLKLPGIETQNTFPQLGPVAPLFFELLSRTIFLGGRLAGGGIQTTRLFEKNRHVLYQRMAAEHARKLEDLHDLID